MKGGMIVEWENAEGENPEGKQKGIAYRSDQRPEFSNFKKVFIRLVNDDFTQKTKDGKKLIGLKHESQLKIIGYID
jgi:hypothetical protein